MQISWAWLGFPRGTWQIRIFLALGDFPAPQAYFTSGSSLSVGVGDTVGGFLPGGGVSLFEPIVGGVLDGVFPLGGGGVSLIEVVVGGVLDGVTLGEGAGGVSEFEVIVGGVLDGDVPGDVPGAGGFSGRDVIVGGVPELVGSVLDGRSGCPSMSS